MRSEVAIGRARVEPQVDGILRLLEMPEANPRTRGLIERAVEMVEKLARPRGIFQLVGTERFRTIYRGQGHNEPVTPLDSILDRSERMALFAVTLGEGVEREISSLFAAYDPALACLLDAAASEAAEQAADAVEEAFASTLAEPDRSLALRYSPGYCGWHVTGQRALFEELRPETIGIRLRESCLMEPLKSISGVIIAGPPEIHEVEAIYPFCARCATKGCGERARRTPRA